MKVAGFFLYFKYWILIFSFIHIPCLICIWKPCIIGCSPHLFRHLVFQISPSYLNGKDTSFYMNQNTKIKVQNTLLCVVRQKKCHHHFIQYEIPFKCYAKNPWWLWLKISKQAIDIQAHFLLVYLKNWRATRTYTPTNV